MKVKRMNGYDETLAGVKFISHQNWVIKGFEVDLGNNFTMGHFVEALPEWVVDFIWSHIMRGDSVRIVANGKYNKCILNTCGNDLFDFLR